MARKKISMLGSYRKLGGERMALHGGRSRTKASAKKAADSLRRFGRRARILKHPNGWAVYTGGRRR